MSLSDYLKYLRATKGGVTPWEIAEEAGVPASEVHMIEVKHRRVGENNAVLDRLAGYFGVPVEELTTRREMYRKLLTQFLAESQGQDLQVTLRLESGEELTGAVSWYSREAVALLLDAGGGQPAGPCIVQRSWIAGWQAL